MVIMFFGLPSMPNKLNNDYAIVTEVVPINEFTNIKIKKANKTLDEKKFPTKSTTPLTSKVAPASPVNKTMPTITEDAEKAPNPLVKNKVSEKPKPPLKIQDDKKSTQEKKVAQMPQDKKVADKKNSGDDFAKNILKSLEKDVKKSDTLDKEFDEIEKLLKGETNKEFNSQLPLSMSEIDGIKSQITNSWNTASFSGSAEKGLSVIVRIKLDRQGNVMDVKAVPESNSSPYYRAFVESTIRAVRSASPLKNLSPDKFSTWGEIEFRFDSSGMIY